MRILLVIAGLPAGGAERQHTLLGRALIARGHEVGFLVFNSLEKAHYRPPGEFTALDRRGIFRGIRRKVREFRPDVIHASLNIANHATRLSFPGVPVVTSVRNDFDLGYRWHEKLAERLLWRRSAMVTCNSEHIAGQLAKFIPADRIALIPNAVEERFFTGPMKRPDWWPEGRTALFVGRFVGQKNPLALSEALKGTGWTPVFVGEGPLKPEGVVHAPVADPRPLYRACTVFVLPSLYEGVSNACLEARAAGCPVVTDIKRLKEVCAMSEEDRRLMGAEGREYVREHHTVTAMAEAAEAVYGKVNGNPVYH